MMTDSILNNPMNTDPVDRLLSVDFMRGIALSIVLIDHIDHVALDFSFLVHWSLKGLGFSDFADVFAFLSGFTFGWVYGEYASRKGVRQLAGKLGMRWTQLLLGYVVTSVTVLLISCLAIHQTVHSSDGIRQSFVNTLWLGFQPFTLMIICMYIAVLPVLGVALLTYLRFSIVTIMTSGFLYCMVQLYPQINLSCANGAWFFNPFAWQFFMVLAMAVGCAIRQSTKSCVDLESLANSKGDLRVPTIVAEPRWKMGRHLFVSNVILTISLSMLAFGLFVEKGDLLFGAETHQSVLSATHFSQNESMLIDKTRIAPLRIVYFFSLAYVVYRLLPKNDAFWKKTVFKPLLACGRNSLIVYCVGVVLTHLSSVAFDWMGVSPLIVVMVALNACMIQFVAAILIDDFRRKSRIIRRE